MGKTMGKKMKDNIISTSLLNQNYLNLKAECDRLSSELELAMSRLDAYKLVIKECTIPAGESDSLQYSDNLEEAMLEIAAEDGFFDTYEHKEKLIENGIIQGDSRAISQKIYQTLEASEHFEPNGKKGRWNLMASPRDFFGEDVPY